MTEKIYNGTFAQAIQDINIKPGDRLLLHAGTYKADHYCKLTGTEAEPITIKAYPGERPILDGNFATQNDWLVFEGIEFMFSGWLSRQSAEAGSAPSDMPIKDVNLRGNNNMYIGCIFHDLRGGVLWYTIGGEMHDCISYFHGWQGTDRKHGHAYYIHNGAIPKKMINCLGFDSFGYGIALYSTKASDPLDNVAFEQCVMFGSGRLPLGSGDNYNLHIGGETGVSCDNISLTRCMTYDGLPVRIGYNGGVTNLTQADNLFDISVDGVWVHPSQAIANRGNIIVYNSSQAESVTVNVSSILTAGDTYKLHNARGFWVDIATGEVTQDGTIEIDMRAASHSIATPVALGDLPNGFPNFGAFVLEKQ